MKLINKDALIAEINKRINKIDLNNIEDWRYRIQREHDIEVMKNIISIVNTLEVKEVDLDEEFDKCCENYMFDDECEVYTAKKFFELGIKVAHKGE